ncbi:nucleoside hydrolase [Rothia sp. AR01]|uniref:Nucleoside hydrolase n=1 Tax=Rothia santali TaxID=2949643 RepID=A0A9X2HFI7_9MICC|nr:nucleoside hydrolase [Rothia santali]MCP3426777.1 nucleoside hydrolase [Rothia santali]
MPTPVILDVDTGIDDAMAVMFAARHPEIDLLAISCVTGNTSLENVVANTCKVLDVVGAPEIPVAGGALRPLLAEPRDASFVHGEDGMGGVELPESARRPVPEHAVEMLRRVLTEAEQPVTLVALAPLTNIALLLRMYPHVAGKIGRILFMGGSASVGNATAVAEFNIWHDPEAARIVLNSGVPMTMYGLDVFNTVAVDEATIRRLIAAEGAAARALGGLLGFRMHDVADGEQPSSLIGDAGAVCALVAPHLMQTRRHPVQVSTEGITRGQTVVDRRWRAGEDEVHGLAARWPEIDVVLAADIPAVVELFLDAVEGADAGGA